MGELRECARNRLGDTRFSLAVLGIFRNEAHVLREWIEHYRLFGAEHIFLIDNNSDDGFREIVAPYQQAGFVDLFSCPRDGYQVGAYMEVLPLIERRAEWVGVFDLDELIYPPSDANFQAVLDRFSDAEAVLIPWLSFGSNGHKTQPASLTRSFTRRGSAECSRSFLKAFSRPRCIELLSQHNPVTRNSVKYLANGAPFGDDWWISLAESELTGFRLVNNHYRLQSLDYFRNVKAARPEVNEDAQDRAKTMKFFEEYDALWSAVVDRRLADIRDRLERDPLAEMSACG